MALGHAVDTVPGIPADARLHIVTGKGGTGKTTVAGALALALAEGGRRTLLVEVEGRQTIAQMFDVPALPYQEQRVATSAGGGEVWGLSIDPEEALIEYLDMFYNLKRSAKLLKKMGAIDFATTLAPGVRDVLLTGKVKEATSRTNKDGSPTYHAVVLDGPPTGRIRQFLDATREVADLTKFGPINKQSTGVIQLLHSRKTAIHLVTLLEEMPVQETVDGAAELTKAGFELGAIIVNRARPQLVPDDQLDADGQVDVAALSRGLAKAGLAKALAEPLADQITQYEQRQAVQAANEERLANVDVPRIVLPELNPPVDVGELHDLAGYFVKGDIER